MQIEQKRDAIYMKRAKIIKIKQINTLLEWGNASIVHSSHECINAQLV